MGTIAIFPSLSRVASMDSSEQAADDTIRDGMDLGYVATRPRFTRERRTWAVNHRNLAGEDVRALRNFRANTVQRGALPFYYPNLVKNGSFEFSAELDGDLACEWVLLEADSGFQVSVGNDLAADGLQSLRIYAPGTTLAAGHAIQASIGNTAVIPCNVGDVYQFNASIALAATLVDGHSFAAGVKLLVTYEDESTQTVSASITAANTGFASPSFSAVSFQLAIPSSGSAAASNMQLSLYSSASNPSGAGISGVAQMVHFDSVGLALITSGAPSIAMAGSAPLPVLVRFAPNKLPQFADLGWIKGAKAYGASFSLEEV